MRRAYLLAFKDSEDEYIVYRPRWIRDREDHFHSLDDNDFVTRFRITKRTVLDVLEAIGNNLEFPSDRNDCISPINQLLCTLRFYATGCFLTTAADLSGISTSSVHRIVHRVSSDIASLRPLHVVFPETPDDIRKTQLDFYNKARFPKVLGAIDCTHVKLGKSPGGANAEIFRNRKGYFSLNVQAIFNAKLEFSDIVARWPAVLMTPIFLTTLIEELCYMMTPLDRCQTAAEHLFNESQIRKRNPIERLFGVWKRRFPSMALGLRVNLEKCFPIIVASVVLHNIATRAGENVPPHDPALVLPAPWEAIIAQGNIRQEHPNYLQHRQGGPRRGNPNHSVRRVLVENYFERLVRQDDIIQRNQLE